MTELTGRQVLANWGVYPAELARLNEGVLQNPIFLPSALPRQIFKGLEGSDTPQGYDYWHRWANWFCQPIVFLVNGEPVGFIYDHQYNDQAPSLRQKLSKRYPNCSIEMRLVTDTSLDVGYDYEKPGRS